ncbi:MAG: hypothetical protein H0Z35_09195 [Thermoanaerobacteraceae bacterium]|nr:hypothetical protein [Thermoanaerobacteraceae bacterium]
MTPTAELRSRLRKLLNEVIPTGGTESDTRFLDADLDELLTEAVNIYGAAAAGWTMKAGMLQSQIESYSVGQEKYDLTSLKDQLSHALAMADRYANMARVSGGSVLLKITPPEVL